MNERELDRMLAQGRKEAGGFFNGFKPAPKQLAAGAAGRGRRAWRPRAMRRVAAAAACMAAAIACTLFLLSPPAGRTLPGALAQADSAPAQTVALGDDKEYRMNYIPTGAQDGAVPGIMTVLWELSGDGNQQVAYSSVFEYCDTVYPAMIIPFSGADYDMLLIASGDSAHGSIGYRLVGYRADAIQTWWSRDDLLGGAISVQDGVAVEKAADGDAALRGAGDVYCARSDRFRDSGAAGEPSAPGCGRTAAADRQRRGRCGRPEPERADEPAGFGTLRRIGGDVHGRGRGRRRAARRGGAKREPSCGQHRQQLTIPQKGTLGASALFYLGCGRGGLYGDTAQPS